MLTKPERVVFNSTLNMVDYVGRGLPPTRKDYNRFIQSIEFKDDNEPVNPNAQRFAINVPKDEMIAILDRVYENNRHNQMITIGAFIGGVATGMGVALKFMRPLEIFYD